MLVQEALDSLMLGCAQNGPSLIPVATTLCVRGIDWLQAAVSHAEAGVLSPAQEASPGCGFWRPRQPAAATGGRAHRCLPRHLQCSARVGAGLQSMTIYALVPSGVLCLTAQQISSLYMCCAQCNVRGVSVLSGNLRPQSCLVCDLHRLIVAACARMSSECLAVS